ncbi:MAG: hypothetical protein ACK559_19240, partial [bacterium]
MHGPPRVIRRPFLRRRKVRLPLADGLDRHNFGLLSLITLARPLIGIARFMTAGSCGVGNILQCPFFSVLHELHKCVCMVAWGILHLAAPPLFY